MSHALSPLVASNTTSKWSGYMTADFIVGAQVALNSEGPAYPISSVMADRFQVYVVGIATYPAGTAVRVLHSFVARVSGNTATRISQIFLQRSQRMYRLAKAGEALLAASVDQRLWTIAWAASAAARALDEIRGARPLSGAPSTLA